MPSWNVLTSKSALKSLARAPRHERDRLRAALDQIAVLPRNHETIPLTNERAAFRRRVGDWRVFFDLDDVRHTVFVVAIERRTSTTYRKR